MYSVIHQPTLDVCFHSSRHFPCKNKMQEATFASPYPQYTQYNFPCCTKKKKKIIGPCHRPHYPRAVSCPMSLLTLIVPGSAGVCASRSLTAYISIEFPFGRAAIFSVNCVRESVDARSDSGLASLLPFRVFRAENENVLKAVDAWERRVRRLRMALEIV